MKEATEFVFSYGTLQHADVQQTHYSRLSTGEPDTLVGYALATVAAGATGYPVARPADDDARVPGVVYALTPQELATADADAGDDYRRVATVLASGRHAWVYVANATGNREQLRYWSEEGGTFWIAFRDRFQTLMAPFAQRALAAFDAQSGERVLDVGCGCGERALDLAWAVGPRGRVVGVDISAPMLDIARDEAARAGFANVAFVAADAQTHRFDDAPFDGLRFDGVFSFFGVMFFDDPPAAFANLARALKPSGRLVFVCWRSREEHEWWTLPVGIALRHAPDTVIEAPTTSGAYSLADPSTIRALLAGAGFDEIAVEPFDVENGGLDVEDALAYIRAGSIADVLTQHPDKVASIEAELRDALTVRRTERGVFLRSGVWIVGARRAR